MNSILLVEDEANVRKPLEDYLRKEGFQVFGVSSIREAEASSSGIFDLVLLDWMLPDGQGIELLKKWRGNAVTIPVILLTARADLVDKVLGLELGAHDYVTKPFEPRELVARIRVQLRNTESDRIQKPQDTVIEHSGLALNVSTREAAFGGRPLDLTKTEFSLMRIFLENPLQVYSREELLKEVWGYDHYPTTRTVDTHVLQLRQKTKPELFETVHGIGYRFRPAKI